MRFVICAVIVFLATPLVLSQEDKPVKVFKGEENGERVLRHEVVVNGSLKDVWDMFTTTEGYLSWMTPVAYVDFREGGLVETSYTEGAKQGDPANIVTRISNIKQLKSYESKLTKMPENNPYGTVLLDLHNKISFEAVGKDRVKVSIAMIGWNDSEEHQKVMGFFEGGNTWYCQRLIKRCDEGPLKWEGVN